jgi:hypothetical protein
MAGRLKREKQRAYARVLREKYGRSPCPKCGALAAHFVPPGLGDPGFFCCAISECYIRAPHTHGASA